MKKSLLLLCALALAAFTRATEFTFQQNQLPPLVDALAALDGYEHTVEQGPGNPSRVVSKEPYKFSKDTRTRLAANLAAIVKAWRAFNDKLGDIREGISGDRNKIDDKDPAQMKAWREKTKPLGDTITVDLSPITSAELTENDNPIPISTLSVLNLLRPAAPAK